MSQLIPANAIDLQDEQPVAPISIITDLINKLEFEFMIYQMESEDE